MNIMESQINIICLALTAWQRCRVDLFSIAWHKISTGEVVTFQQIDIITNIPPSYIVFLSTTNNGPWKILNFSFQSRKRLYNHKCPFIRLSVRNQNPKTT